MNKLKLVIMINWYVESDVFQILYWNNPISKLLKAKFESGHREEKHILMSPFILLWYYTH